MIYSSVYSFSFVCSCPCVSGLLVSLEICLLFASHSLQKHIDWNVSWSSECSRRTAEDTYPLIGCQITSYLYSRLEDSQFAEPGLQIVAEACEINLIILHDGSMNILSSISFSCFRYQTYFYSHHTVLDFRSIVSFPQLFTHKKWCTFFN